MIIAYTVWSNIIMCRTRLSTYFFKNESGSMQKKSIIIGGLLPSLIIHDYRFSNLMFRCPTVMIDNHDWYINDHNSNNNDISMIMLLSLDMLSQIQILKDHVWWFLINDSQQWYNMICNDQVFIESTVGRRNIRLECYIRIFSTLKINKPIIISDQWW